MLISVIVHHTCSITWTKVRMFDNYHKLVLLSPWRKQSTFNRFPGLLHRHVKSVRYHGNLSYMRGGLFSPQPWMYRRRGDLRRCLIQRGSCCLANLYKQWFAYVFGDLAWLANTAFFHFLTLTFTTCVLLSPYSSLCCMGCIEQNLATVGQSTKSSSSISEN
jgi:hypothetical protein